MQRKTFWYYLFWRRRASLSIAALLGLIGGIADLAVPVLLGQFVDELTGTGPAIVSSRLVLLLTLLMVSATALSSVSSLLIGLVAEESVLQLRGELVKRAFRQRIYWYSKVSSGGWSSRLTNDPEKIRVAINNGPVEIFLQASLLIGSLLIMLWISPSLLLVVIVLMLSGTLVVIVLSGKMDLAVGRSQTKIGLLADYVVSGFQNIRTLRANKLTNRYEEQTLNVVESTYLLGRAVTKSKSLIVPVGTSVVQLSLVVVFGVGASLIGGGKLTVGELMSFLMLILYLSVPLIGLFGAIAAMRSSKTAFQRIIDAAPKEIVEDHVGRTFEAKNTKAGIELNSVYFKHPGQAVLFEDVSLKIPTGKIVALVGPSGSGKSSLFDLIVKFVHPQSGDIKIFGTDISEVSNDSVRDLLSFSQQQSRPLGDSIRAYLGSARRGVTEQDMWEALERVLLLEKISSLGEGLETKLGVQGQLFSGGELQRLSLAHSFLRDAPIVLLDEPTTGLDAKTQQDVLANLLPTLVGKTCLIATHNIELMNACDFVIDLRDL